MRKILNINQNWSFYKDCDYTEGISGGNTINLPHTWNAADGQDGGNDYFRGKCLYIKNLNMQELPVNDKYYLEVKGANSSAVAYVNGKRLGEHDGGYSTWRVDITAALKGNNQIAIVVDNSPNDRVYPQTADFTFYGGLYRSVNIIAVNSAHFDLEYYGAPGIAVTPTVQDKDAYISINTFVSGAKDGDEVRFKVLERDGTVIASGKSENFNAQLKIENVKLWQGVKDPYLYTAVAELVRDGQVLDEVSTRFGCRTFKIDAKRGFILNGEEYALRGVSRHQDRLGIGNALLPEHHEQDINLILELGANTVRLAHYQHDDYFYDLCDEVGLVVWAEIPYISANMPNACENALNQMKELVYQNYNHACIAVWGLSNEITMARADGDMLKTHELLNNFCHSVDPIRFTTVACVSVCSPEEPYIKIPDAVAYNHYFGWYGGDTSMNGPWFDEFHKKYPDVPIGVSEYGCEGLNWHTSNPTQGDYTEEYQSYYHEELIKQLFTRKYLWATYVWNMFDFGADARAEGGENGQNHKGLVTMDRKYKKDAFYAYKAWLSSQPFVHICGKRYVDRVEDITKVTVYSNQPQVELFVNGKSVGKKFSPEHFFYFEVENVGESKIVAVAGEYSDCASIRKVESENQDYVLKEKGAVLNWYDVTAPKGKYSINDKISDLLKSERARVWLLSFIKDIKSSDKSDAFSAFSELSESAMQTLGGFTVLRMTTMLAMMNIKFTKEQLLEMNARLNEIDKVE